MNDNDLAGVGGAFTLLIATDPHRNYTVQPAYHARAPRLSGHPHRFEENFTVSVFPGVEDGTASCFYGKTLPEAVMECVNAVKTHNAKSHAT